MAGFERRRLATSRPFWLAHAQRRNALNVAPAKQSFVSKEFVLPGASQPLFLFMTKTVQTLTRRPTIGTVNRTGRKSNPLPRHVGFIPDGNRRWALDRGMNKEAGYARGIA